MVSYNGFIRYNKNYKQTDACDKPVEKKQESLNHLSAALQLLDFGTFDLQKRDESGKERY